MADITTSAPAPAPAGAIALWPVDVLARQLLSENPVVRTVALGMAVQPGAPIQGCVDSLAGCAQLSVGDALASQLAATALGSLPPPSATEAVLACLVLFIADGEKMPVRIAAAHALFRLARLPAGAHDPLCSLLLDTNPNARKVALLAFSPFATSAAGAIARRVASIQPQGWTMEALQALVKSAGDDAAARGKIEGFVMRSLASAPLVPAGIAGYTLLARLNPQGAAIAALVQVAGDAANPDASSAALEALGELGETARPAAKSIAQLLAATDDPAREELLCRTLVRLRSPAGDVPVARVLHRVRSAPDRSTAAHCMLLCLHPKEFAQAASIVQQRRLAASDALQKALAQTYKTLTGMDLTGSAAAGKV
jgi:predicted nucleic acid-binding protein